MPREIPVSGRMSTRTFQGTTHKRGHKVSGAEAWKAEGSKKGRTKGRGCAADHLKWRQRALQRSLFLVGSHCARRRGQRRPPRAGTPRGPGRGLAMWDRGCRSTSWPRSSARLSSLTVGSQPSFCLRPSCSSSPSPRIAPHVLHSSKHPNPPCPCKGGGGGDAASGGSGEGGKGWQRVAVTAGVARGGKDGEDGWDGGQQK